MEGKLIQCCYREQIGYAVYRTFCEPKLYRLAATGEWDSIPRRCRAHPTEASFRHKYPPQDTALHRIVRVTLEEQNGGDACNCYQELKTAATRAVLDAFPDATRISDTFGRTPLHLACMDPYLCVTSTCSGANSASSAGTCLVEEIYLQHPKAANTLDVEQRTPLHYLIARSGHVIDPRIVRLLASPEAIQQKDVVGDTPYTLLDRRRTQVENSNELLALLQDSSAPRT